MNQSKYLELKNANSIAHGKLLQSGALGTIIVGKATRILDAENLKEGKFIRCEVSNKKPTGWGRDIKYVDIPEIALQKAIKFGSVGTGTRLIVSCGSQIGSKDSLTIESYNSDSHELHVIGQDSGRFTLKIPVSYSDYDNTDRYLDLGNNLRPNPTQPKYESIFGQLNESLKR